jgi:hypothetical protein
MRWMLLWMGRAHNTFVAVLLWVLAGCRSLLLMLQTLLPHHPALSSSSWHRRVLTWRLTGQKQRRPAQAHSQQQVRDCAQQRASILIMLAVRQASHLWGLCFHQASTSE